MKRLRSPFILSANAPKTVISFKGAVFFSARSLAGCCRNILPFKAIFSDTLVCNELQIESPLRHETVAENLLCLSKEAESLSKEFTPSKLEKVDKLKSLFMQHYEYLEEHGTKENVAKLEGEMCFLIPVTDKKLCSHVVGANQLFFHTECDLEPFCYCVALMT